MLSRDAGAVKSPRASAIPARVTGGREGPAIEGVDGARATSKDGERKEG